MKSFSAIAVGAVIVAAWPGAPQGAGAFDADGTYMVHGTGQSTCREWLIDRRIGDAGAWQLQQWVLGYVTAYNEFVRGPADIIDGLQAEGLFSWFDAHCGTNQTDVLSSAIRTLISERLAASGG